ncbi:MAG: Zn-ribbon domain-containing OB-fold protein [Desulfatibacillaceae bacterium]|nr:Zn-ribbon domain-containing OB-fold protein [Desulfatibacillaceae bacterium]
MTTQNAQAEQFDMTRPLPIVQPWSEAFWAGAREGKLLLQHCKECSATIFYPRKFCPECWSADIEWRQASGKATVYTFSTAYDMVEPRFWADLPYTIAYVDLAEGPRMMTRIVDCAPEDIKVGMKVEVTFHKLDDKFSLPFFRPAAK